MKDGILAGREKECRMCEEGGGGRRGGRETVKKVMGGEEEMDVNLT